MSAPPDDGSRCPPTWAPLYAIMPLLSCVARGKRGTFLELGAHDGITSSNTLLLEDCMKWQGVLIEGNPQLIGRLRANRNATGRRVQIIHSAVSSKCSADGTIAFAPASRASEQAGLADVLAARGARHTKWWQNAPVSCAPLRVLLARTLPRLGATRLDFASIDVEGSERFVVESMIGVSEDQQGTSQQLVDPLLAARSRAQGRSAVLPTVILIEATGPASKDAAVEALLLSAHYVRARALEVRVRGHPSARNRVFVLPDGSACADFVRAPPADLAVRCNLRGAPIRGAPLRVSATTFRCGNASGV